MTQQEIYGLVGVVGTMLVLVALADREFGAPLKRVKLDNGPRRWIVEGADGKVL